MSLENLILNIVDGIADANYLFLGQIIIAISIVFWLVVTSWIWVDSEERTTSIWVRVFYVVIGIIPILGWIIYLIIRPTETIDEIYWGDLERRYLKYETKDLGDCSKCGTQIFPSFIYCPNCKNQIKQKCSSCEVFVDIDYKYCTNCGNRMRRDVVKEEIPTTENMKKQIDETKDEARTTVKEKKSKFKIEKVFITKIWESVKEGYKILWSKITQLFGGKDEAQDTGESKDEPNSSIERKEKKGNRKKKKRKKKKKIGV